MVQIYSWGNEFSYEFLRATDTAPVTPGQAPAMGGVQSGIRYSPGPPQKARTSSSWISSAIPIPTRSSHASN